MPETGTSISCACTPNSWRGAEWEQAQRHSKSRADLCIDAMDRRHSQTALELHSISLADIRVKPIERFQARQDSLDTQALRHSIAVCRSALLSHSSPRWPPSTWTILRMTRSTTRSKRTMPASSATTASTTSPPRRTTREHEARRAQLLQKRRSANRAAENRGHSHRG